MQLSHRVLASMPCYGRCFAEAGQGAWRPFIVTSWQVKCSVKIGSPWVWDEEWQDYVEKEPDVSAVGSLVEVKDPKALRAREFRADMVHGPGASNEDIIMCDLAPTLEAVLNGTDATLLVAGVEGGAQAELMDGAEGLAAAAVWQLSQELHERQANHRSNGAVGYSYHMRLQAFQLNGDAIVDLLTDAPDAARLVELPKGVQAQNVRTASATSADDAWREIRGVMVFGRWSVVAFGRFSMHFSMVSHSYHSFLMFSLVVFDGFKAKSKLVLI